ncbi:hypothetical protein HUN08_16555 [Gordonia sp. X0973]|uniref:hypothetical protein n=1 Tax=Gordonia sp. X0973 TaxID=2742602 RepID=UPI000F532825|nr:hypothetical protein [Gordonia sp. X0973]QKT08634.1 hypothetical protein HUN08_16555 [Gordonia sp. X0973]
MNQVSRISLVGVIVGIVAAVLSAGAANASAHGHRFACHSDWRGDTACIRATRHGVSAHGRDEYPGAMVYLSIVHARDGRVVAGPVGGRSLRVSLPPGRYYANYYVAATDIGQGDAQTDSPVVKAR